MRNNLIFMKMQAWGGGSMWLFGPEFKTLPKSSTAQSERLGFKSWLWLVQTLGAVGKAKVLGLSHHAGWSA